MGMQLPQRMQALNTNSICTEMWPIYLVTTVRMDVNTGQKARLRWVRVDPAQRIETSCVLHVKNLLLA